MPVGVRPQLPQAESLLGRGARLRPEEMPLFVILRGLIGMKLNPTVPMVPDEQ